MKNPGEGHVGGSFQKKRFCRAFLSIFSSKGVRRIGKLAILFGFSPKNGCPERKLACDMAFFPGFKRGPREK